MSLLGRAHTSRARVIVSFGIGVAVGLLTAATGSMVLAPLVGWDAVALSYVVWSGLREWRMDAAATAAHAVREDPGRTISLALLIAASIASLGAVAAVIASASTYRGQVTAAAVGLGSVGLSWTLVHTVYTTRYARIYYSDRRGVDFHERITPQYSDFAYLAFTIGMTFQVSDTDLTTRRMRTVALRHALLSFGLGAVILATTINLVAGLTR